MTTIKELTFRGKEKIKAPWSVLRDGLCFAITYLFLLVCWVLVACFFLISLFLLEHQLVSDVAELLEALNFQGWLRSLLLRVDVATRLQAIGVTSGWLPRLQQWAATHGIPSLEQMPKVPRWVAYPLLGSAVYFLGKGICGRRGRLRFPLDFDFFDSWLPTLLLASLAFFLLTWVSPNVALQAGLVGIGGLVFGLWPQLKAKRTDITLKHNEQFAALLLEGYSSTYGQKNPGTKDEVPGKSFFLRFWGLQQSQFKFWRQGLISGDSMVYWLTRRLQGFSDKKETFFGYSPTKGWDLVAGHFDNSDFGVFMAALVESCTKATGTGDGTPEERRLVIERMLIASMTRGYGGVSWVRATWLHQWMSMTAPDLTTPPDVPPKEGAPPKLTEMGKKMWEVATDKNRRFPETRAAYVLVGVASVCATWFFVLGMWSVRQEYLKPPKAQPCCYTPTETPGGSPSPTGTPVASPSPTETPVAIVSPSHTPVASAACVVDHVYFAPSTPQIPGCGRTRDEDCCVADASLSNSGCWKYGLARISPSEGY